MSEQSISRERPLSEATEEEHRRRQRDQGLQEIDAALRQEAALVRALANSDAALRADLASSLQETAIRLDAIAWQVRNFDPAHPDPALPGLAARAGLGDAREQVAARDVPSGEGTRTDLGEGPGGTDTKG